MLNVVQGFITRSSATAEKQRVSCACLPGGAENAGRENDGREIDGPMCRA